MLEVEIRVKGHLNKDWSDQFGGLAVTHTSDGDTLFRGPVRDQPELRGLLSWLADLGMELVSVTTETVREPSR